MYLPPMKILLDRAEHAVPWWQFPLFHRQKDDNLTSPKLTSQSLRNAWPWPRCSIALAMPRRFGGPGAEEVRCSVGGPAQGSGAFLSKLRSYDSTHRLPFASHAWRLSVTGHGHRRLCRHENSACSCVAMSEATANDSSRRCFSRTVVGASV